jgi:hypothetical protein
MQNRTKFLAALVLLTLPMAPSVILNHAEAAPPAVVVTNATALTPGPVCRSSDRKIDKIRKWEYNTPFFKDPDQGTIYHDDATHMIRFKLIADMRYTLCPRGIKVDLIKPRSIRYCYGVVYDDHDEMHDQNTFVLFDGWTMNAEAEDDFRSVNPPPKKIPEEGKANCVRQNIATTEQKWLRRDQDPGYEVKATLNIHVKSDRSWMMKSRKLSGTWIAYRFFKPDTDPTAAGGLWYTGTGRITTR